MQIIHRTRDGIKHLRPFIDSWALPLIIVLVGLSSYGLGRLSALESTRPAVSLKQAPEAQEIRSMQMGGLLVASKNGSSYFYPWCSGASAISLSNQIWFKSSDEAKRAGYRPAKNCTGLE